MTYKKNDINNIHVILLIKTFQTLYKRYFNPVNINNISKLYFTT